MRKSIVEALECRRMMAHVNTGEFGGAEAFVFPNSPVNLSGGVLTITGSSHADSITVGRETAPVLESLSEVPLADGSRLDLVRMEVPQAMHGGTPVTATQVTALHPASTLAAGPYIRVHFAHGTGNNDYYVVASQVSSINISTGAGNDHIIIKKVGVPAIVSAGKGNDTVQTSGAADRIMGGTGDDTIIVGSLSALISTADGGDTMVTGTTSTHLIDAVLNPMSASDILASL